jgi:hypothetical protein
MKQIIGFSILSAIGIVCFSCGKVEHRFELEALKEQQKKEELAHRSNDALLFDDIFADTVCQIKNGAVAHLTNDQLITRFRTYFGNVSFLKWEDTVAPVYIISDDSTLAYVLVQKHVELITNTDSTRAIQKNGLCVD